MSPNGKNDGVREHDHLVEPMYGGLEVDPPSKRPPIVPLFIGFVLGVILLLVWLLLFLG